jgi:hypothetical protein
MARIQLTDTATECIVKLSNGNPGAVNVLAQMVKVNAEVDPDSAFGSFSSLLSLDTLEVYAERIWMLYKDVCQQNMNHTIALLRACQLGFVGRAALNHAIDNRGAGIDVADLCAQVKERLPDFKLS